MGEVQYIVTLPQTNQPSAIQLPSNFFYFFVLFISSNGICSEHVILNKFSSWSFSVDNQGGTNTKKLSKSSASLNRKRFLF